MAAAQIHLVDNLYVTREIDIDDTNLHFVLQNVVLTNRKIKFFVGEATHNFRRNVDQFMIGDANSIEIGDNSAWIDKVDDDVYEFRTSTRDNVTTTFELTRNEAFAVVREMQNAFAGVTRR